MHPIDGESLAPSQRGDRMRLERDALYWHFPGYVDTRMRPNSVINNRSVAVSLAGFGGGRPQRPGPRIAIPAAFR